MQKLKLEDRQKIWRHFTKEDVQMADKHRKRYPASSVIRETQVRIPVSYDDTVTKTAEIKKTPTVPRVASRTALWRCW